MKLLTIDIGGTFIKYGLFESESATLSQKDKVPTPQSWREMKELLIKIREQFDSIEGVAISIPGAPDDQARTIQGESNISFVHNFPIYDELEAAFGLPVSFENDANCAALAELVYGSAKDASNIVFAVFGTGVGGAIILDGKLVRGANNYAGEFGFMQMGLGGLDFGQAGTAVALAKRYAERVGADPSEIGGEEVFSLAAANDPVAQEEVARFFDIVALGLYNVSGVLNPEKIVIGGGVSKAEGFIENVMAAWDRIEVSSDKFPYPPEIVTTRFYNDANLIGATVKFEEYFNS